MKIDKVMIVIESLDNENASVKLVTDPTPAMNDEIEDSPAVTLGASIWDLIEQYLELGDESVRIAVGSTLQ